MCAKKRERGDGSIYQRESDGLYVAYARVPETGKRRYVYSRTRGEVAKKLKELQRSIAARTLVTAKAETVESYLIRWLDIHRAQIKESTYAGYKIHLQCVYPLIGHIKLTKLAGDHLQEMYTTLQDGEHDQSPNTVRLIHTILLPAFKDAIKWKRLSYNPCKDVAPPKQEKHEVGSSHA